MDELHIPRDRMMIVIKVIVRAMVRLLALMMTVVIILGVVDVGWTLHQKAMAPPRFILTISDILATFGAFMAVLIAIEILVNIILYLRDDVIHVKIVMATALMAIARKVIILDYEHTTAEFIWATAGVVLAMSIGYWIVHHLDPVRGMLKQNGDTKTRPPDPTGSIFPVTSPLQDENPPGTRPVSQSIRRSTDVPPRGSIHNGHAG